MYINLEKISATLSFVIYFAHRFLRKKLNGGRKFCHRKDFGKKYMGGVPRITELGQNLKKYFQKYQFAISPYEEINSI